MKPVAEVLVEGELSPFEHETIFQILKRRFNVSQPSYTDLPDDNLVTRVTILFHHPYNSSFFTDVFQEGWRDLKGILREIRHRRGGAGAAFNLVFINDKTRLVFKLGLLRSEEMISAIDQIGHLTGVLRMIMNSWTMNEPLVRIECVFDEKSDRWQDYRGYLESDRQVFVFEDASFKWTMVE